MKKPSKRQRQNPSISSTPLTNKPTNYLATASSKLVNELNASGLRVGVMEPQMGKGKYIVTFVPRKKASRINSEIRVIPSESCPACGTIIEIDGRCRACWGDVVGLCNNCDRILDEDFLCPTCAPTEH